MPGLRPGPESAKVKDVALECIACATGALVELACFDNRERFVCAPHVAGGFAMPLL